jgi:thiol-disulfide isomerase/thioredoxin
MFAKSSISRSRAGAARRRHTRISLFGLSVFLLSASAAHALGPGDAPPPVDMADLGGKKVDLKVLEGKVVVIDFWASWCGPCKEEMPVLESLHQKYAERGLVIVGINIDRSAKKMNKFLKSTSVTFRIVHDPKITIAQKYEPSTMPSSYFIGRNGKLRYIHEGFSKKDAAELEERIKALLAESK